MNAESHVVKLPVAVLIIWAVITCLNEEMRVSRVEN